MYPTDVTGDQRHRYSDAGTHTVSITGDFTRIYLNGQQPNANKLQSIEQWGDIRWSSMKGAFPRPLSAWNIGPPIRRTFRA